MMLGTCQMVHSWEGERLGKGSWLPSVSLNSSSYILMHTHRCFMWLEAEGNTCHSSWTQSSQIFKEIQGWRSMLSCLDWAKSFGSIREIFSSGPCFGPHVTACVCSVEIPGGWFSLCLLYLKVCAGVTSGTWHPWHLCLVSCPTFSPLFDLGLMNFFVRGTFPKRGFSYCSDWLFFVLHSVTLWVVLLCLSCVVSPVPLKWL